MTTKRLFISYSHNDFEEANKIYSRLKKQGFRVFLDRQCIKPGQYWSPVIHNSLSKTDVLLLIHTKNSFDSRNVWDEWEYCLNHHKIVIPLIFENTELPYRLASLQFVDFVTDQFEIAFNQLLKTLINLDPDPTSSTTPSSTTKTQRTALALSSNNIRQCQSMPIIIIDDNRAEIGGRLVYFADLSCLSTEQRASLIRSEYLLRANAISYPRAHTPSERLRSIQQYLLLHDLFVSYDPVDRHPDIADTDQQSSVFISYRRADEHVGLNNLDIVHHDVPPPPENIPLSHHIDQDNIAITTEESLRRSNNVLIYAVIERDGTILRAASAHSTTVISEQDRTSIEINQLESNTFMNNQTSNNSSSNTNASNNPRLEHIMRQAESIVNRAFNQEEQCDGLPLSMRKQKL